MKAKTELLLYNFMFGADKFLRPTLRNLTASFEEWAYGNGFWREIAELERRAFIERHADPVAQRVYRLTESGRVYALGGRDPETQWSRPWDGQWRMVLFDIPQAEHSARTRLARLLREHHFGRLQNSVWISPDPLQAVFSKLSAFGDKVTSLITMDGRPASGEPNESIVTAAWDFQKINSLYAEALEVLRKAPVRQRIGGLDRERLRRWAMAERLAWLTAVRVDPLLPEALLPAGYLGKQVWELRKRTLAAINAPPG